MDLDFYYELDKIICEEIDKGKRLAIYPFGKMGMLAKEILNQRYGRDAILIDNKLAAYNRNIITIDSFVKNYTKDITLILCAIDKNVNRKLLAGIASSEITIRNVMAPVEPIHSPEKYEYFKKLKDLCRVRKAKGYSLVRVGGGHDGGYVMIDDFKDNIAYSFGIGDDISWDKEISDKGIDVYCYDPTINKLPQEYPRLTFSKIGIAGKDDVGEQLYSLKTILHNNNHQKRDNLILKMDVEGAEWDFLNETSSEILAQFSQMCFELHGLVKNQNEQKIINALQKIRKTHDPIWIHANNVNGVAYANGIVIPRLLEITFVRKEQYEMENVTYNCPTELDSPNIKERLEIELFDWGTKENE